jgi:ferredoxin
MLDLAHDVCDTSRLGCQIRMSKELDGLIVAVPGAKRDW